VPTVNYDEGSDSDLESLSDDEDNLELSFVVEYQETSQDDPTYNAEAHEKTSSKSKDEIEKLNLEPTVKMQEEINKIKVRLDEAEKQKAEFEELRKENATLKQQYEQMKSENDQMKENITDLEAFADEEKPKINHNTTSRSDERIRFRNFHGNGNEDAVSWITDFELYLEGQKVEKNEYTRIFTQSVRDHANTWFYTDIKDISAPWEFTRSRFVDSFSDRGSNDFFSRLREAKFEPSKESLFQYSLQLKKIASISPQPLDDKNITAAVYAAFPNFVKRQVKCYANTGWRELLQEIKNWDEWNRKKEDARNNQASGIWKDRQEYGNNWRSNRGYRGGRQDYGYQNRRWYANQGRGTYGYRNQGYRGNLEEESRNEEHPTNQEQERGNQEQVEKESQGEDEKSEWKEQRNEWYRGRRPFQGNHQYNSRYPKNG